ncbi:MAG: tetratricopeptide repeat protein [Desulfococcaceae bacterium]|nr:tetratricopeptide repeat protein [Desulfococcaceae bacterium]
MKKYLIAISCIVLLTGTFSCSTTNEKKESLIKQSAASKAVGEAYMQEGDFTMALKELLKAESMYSDDPDLHNDLGLTYMAKERIEPAIQHFTKALKIRPEFTAAKNNLGTAYLAKEDWDAAIRTFTEVNNDLLYTTPHFSESNLAWAYYNKKQYELAEQHYKEALEKEPKFLIALRGLAKTYMAMNKTAEAKASLEKAMDISPRFAPLYLDMAKVQIASGDQRAAVETYKKVIALFPGTSYAEEAQKEAGAMLLNSGQF